MNPLWQVCAVAIVVTMPMVGRTSDRKGNPSGQKSLFRYEYPACLAFRGELNRWTRSDSLAWAASVDSASGFIKKFISEELEIGPQMAGWANGYAGARPEKLALLHLNGEARRICGHPEVQERYFPGHWVYLPGTEVTAPLSSLTIIPCEIGILG